MNAYFKKYEQTKIPFNKGKFDQNGIPMFDLKYLNFDSELIYHPIVIIQFALANYNLWLQKKNSSFLNVFTNCCEWLLLNSKYSKNNNSEIFYYSFDLKTPKVIAPWFSGMAQGQALSLFARAYKQTNDIRFLNHSKKIYNSIVLEFENGGCTTMLNGNKFIQELVCKPFLYILNGALYSLIGIVEYRELIKCNNSEIEDYIKGIEALLPEFDFGFWSKYSIGMRFNLSDNYYHQTHIEQLEFLGKKLNNKVFIYYSNKFNQQKLKKNIFHKIILFFYLNINRFLRIFKLKFLLYRYNN